MSINNRLIALIYRIVLFAMCIIGIIVHIYMDGSLNKTVLIYYTIQSNILCLVVISMVIVDTIIKIKREGIKGENISFPKLKGATTMAITVTFLVFHVILKPTLFDMGMGEYASSFGNISVHYVTPLMFILDWVLFDKKFVYKKTDPIIWTMIPLAYFVFAIIRAQIGGIIAGTDSRYPYFFIDIDQYGWMVALFVLGLLIFFIALGYIILLIDRIYYDKQAKNCKIKKFE